jgi:hypothetical protein
MNEEGEVDADAVGEAINMSIANPSCEDEDASPKIRLGLAWAMPF